MSNSTNGSSSLNGRLHNYDAEDYHRPKAVDELTQRNVDTIVELEEATHAQRTRADRVADAISGFCGTMTFVWVHIVWFSAWIILNSAPFFKHFDPFPFTFLSFCVSLEAIFLSTFILISQNHETRLSERRNHLDLQVNLLTEQENTKMLHMLKRIADKVGANVDDDPEVQVLEEATRPHQLIEQIEQSIERENSRRGTNK